MQLTGERRIEADREAVWRGLNDPEVLKASIPGCEEIEKTADNQFAAKVRTKVGPVSARFAGKVTLSDLDPPKAYTISGEGQGGGAGFAKGSAKVNLEEDGGATLLRYTVDAQVGGKLAQIGSRLIEGTARKMADDFFARFATAVAGPAAEPAAAATEETAPGAIVEEPAPAPQMPPAVGGGLKPVVWIPALLLVLLILVLLFVT
ncbi:MAG: SRPBCC family protein [Kiloniellales bacterium]